MKQKHDRKPTSGEAMTSPAERIAPAMGRRTFLKGALAAAAPLMITGPTLWLPRRGIAATHIGPSTTTEPYLIASVSGVELTSILTVGDSVGSYRMVGIPDGLGAFRSHGHEFTLLMNHELSGTAGVVRGHGSQGAFVSQWIIDRSNLTVLDGADFSQSPDDVYRWDSATNAYLQGTTVWERFCSGDLAAEGAFFARGKGTQERIYLNGEETTTRSNNIVVEQGRPWARIVTGSYAGETWQLPRLGKMAYENVVASPYPQEKTIVALMDDSALSTAGVINDNVPSEVYFYIGNKEKNGHPIVQAGLTNGSLFGVKIFVSGNLIQAESNEFGLGTSGYVGKGRFTLHNLGDVSAMTAIQIEEASIAANIARLQRVEDGAWDPRKQHANDFYFITTASLTSNCRLWRLRFDDIEHPEQGGEIEILLRGDEGHGMLDNVGIDRHGRILMDEDPGNSARISKIWLYGIDTGDFIQVAEHNPKFFDPASPNLLTQDEESSGIIDAEDILGKGWFLVDVQVHKANPDAELVEFGQLLAIYVAPDIAQG